MSNTFQKRNVSSPAPVKIDSPDGLTARYNTRYVCPVNVVVFCTERLSQLSVVFQRLIWFKLYPWVVIISLEILEKTKLQTWEPKIKNYLPVSMQWFCFRVLVEKNLICLSAVPPPEASKDGLLGHHPIAFTAALCSWNLTNSLFFLAE